MIKKHKYIRGQIQMKLMIISYKVDILPLNKIEKKMHFRFVCVCVNKIILLKRMKMHLS